MYFKGIDMKDHGIFCDRSRGFTLIEVIVALTVAAILGTMLVTFMETGITESVRTVARVKNTYDLGKVIENITADYKNTLATDSTPLATFKTNVGATGSTQNNAYGSYKVNYNDYRTFTCTGSNCTEGNGSSSILKVTITDLSNTQTITALFTQ
jgi:prepilin-type N-terminal cleavage/methylation domain-containing protein